MKITLKRWRTGMLGAVLFILGTTTFSMGQASEGTTVMLNASPVTADGVTFTLSGDAYVFDSEGYSFETTGVKTATITINQKVTVTSVFFSYGVNVQGASLEFYNGSTKVFSTAWPESDDYYVVGLWEENIDKIVLKEDGTSRSGLGIIKEITFIKAPPTSAPLLSTNQVDLTTINEDVENEINKGGLVSDLLGDKATSSRTTNIGIAVVARDASNGSWQFSENGTWYSFDRHGGPSETNALLLPHNTSVRFVPASNYNGSAAFIFRAWDQSSGTANGVANTTTNGGSTAYSSSTANASISVTAVNDAPTFTGIEGKNVLRFDGANDHVSIPSISMSGDYTVEAWVYVNQHGTWSRILDFANGPGSDNIFVAFAGSTNELSMTSLVGSAGQAVSQSGAFPVGVWRHVAAVNNGSGTGTLYVDGQVVTKGSQSIPANVLRTLNYLGKSNWSQDAYFNGKMREIRVWDIARTQAQIQENMNSPLSATETGLKIYYPFTEGSGTILTDASGNGLHGTIQNGATWEIDATVQTTLNTLEDTDKSILFQVMDEDAGTGNISLSLTSYNGIFLMKDNISGGLTSAHISGNNSTNVVIEAPLTVINKTIAEGGLVFTPNLNFSGQAKLSATITDNGLTGAGGSKSAFLGFAISVTPVNDAPAISSNGGGTTATANVAENTTAVTTLTATDAESDAIVYSISGGADAAKFNMNSSTGVLSFVAAPDYENPGDANADNTYEVTVRASESGIEGLYHEQAISVTITDVLEDVTPPTVSFSSLESNRTNANPIPVSISFDEAVTGFSAEDLQIGNGAVASLIPPGFAYAATIGKSNYIGSSNDLFSGPMDVAVDAEGKIYVVDRSNHRIQIFNSDYTYFATIGTSGVSGSGNDQFYLPDGIAIDAAGKIYVADLVNHRIQAFNADRTYAATIGTGTQGNNNNQLNAPAEVAIDAAGKIYVADAFNHRIQIFNSDYTYFATIGTSGVSGTGSYQFYFPYGVAIDAAGKIYVADRDNHRIQVFNADRTYAATIGSGTQGNSNNQFSTPNGVSFDAAGKIYVMDRGNHRIQIFNADYTYAATIGTGTRGNRNDQFSFPNSITLDAKGKIYVADNANHRVQLFTKNSTYQATIKPTADGLVTVDMAAGVVTDEAGNGNTAAERFSITYDGTAPGLTISSTEGRSTAKISFPVTFTFTEKVDAFTQADVVVGNGSITDWQTSDYITFTATLSPAAYGIVTVDVAGKAAMDEVGNESTAATQFNIDFIDTIKPTVTIASNEPDPTNHNAIPVSIAFNEAVEGFTPEDLLIGNGTVTSLTAPGLAHVATIGTTGVAGSENNQFNYPYRVAVNNTGKIYVSDSDNKRIQVFNADGSYAATISTATSGNSGDEYNYPYGVAVDAAGKVYVADYNNERIQIFNADGTYAATIGTGIRGSENDQLNSPYGVAVDAAGKVYVADNGNHRIQIFNADYTYAATIGTGSVGSSNEQFNGPLDIAVDAAGKIYVADIGNHRIQIFNADYTYSATIGTGSVGNSNDQFSFPSALSVDANGKIYVADRNNHRIQTFNADYTYAGTIGAAIEGSGNDQFSYPIGVVVDAIGKIYVADLGNHRIQIFENGDAYQALITPAADGLVTVDLPAAKVTDEAGNENIAAERFSITYDGTAPGLTISSEVQSHTNKQTIPLTFTFSEKVEGFNGKDITIGNGSLTELQSSDDITFTASVMPATDGTVTVDVAAHAAWDAAGNYSTAATQFSIRYDATAPEVNITSEEHYLTSKSTFAVSFTFTEEMKAFAEEDITVGNGSMANLQSSDNKTFTADITAEEAGLIALNVEAGVATDNAGNGNTAATQFSITYDLPPVITSGQEFNVLENSVAGTVIGTVEATDILSGTQFQHWFITNNANADGNDLDLLGVDYGDQTFAINSQTGQITVHNADQLDGNTQSFTLSITVSDGVHTSEAENVVINLSPVNDAPVFVKGSNQIVAEEAGLQTVIAWATDIHAGGPAEEGQTLAFVVTNDNVALFALAPVNSANGTLSYTPADNAHGVANVSVVLSDNGGTANGGVDHSATQTFTITISPVNDAPVVGVAIADQKAYKEQAYQFAIPTGSFDDVDTEDVITYSAKLSNGNALPAWLSFNAATQTFSGTPALADKGSLTIVVTATDNSGESVSDEFFLEVVDPNNKPTDILLSVSEVEENKPAGTLVGNFSTSDLDAHDAHIYQLVDGEGSVDNSFFYIEGTELYTNMHFDSEMKTEYSIRVLSDDSNDGAIEKVFIIRIKNVEDARVFIPNLFSPNGDESNDTFRVRANGIQQISFRIFNRMGEMVYETSNVQQATEMGWDGTYKGKEQPSGSYVWQITGKFTDGEAVQFEGKNTGNIILIR